MKEFSKWTINEVEEYFQVTQIDQLSALTEWLAADVPVTQPEERQLSELGAKLLRHVLDWNEEELKMKFIGFVMGLVNYDQEQYQAFFDRSLAVRINRERLAGVVDCMIASGRRVPKRPFFCLHEYKPEKHSSNDPLGQVLVAMIAAQLSNNDGRPIYGAYVVGRNWYFVVLDQKTYAVSLEYDATKEADLTRIFMALRFIKIMIEQELQKDERERSKQ